MKYTAVLSCRSRIADADGIFPQHTLSFRSCPPVTGETLWCLRCGAWSRVIEAPYIWRALCRSCRWPGSTPDIRKDLAMQAAVRHAGRYTTHRVELRQGRVVVQRWAETASDTLEERLQNLLTQHRA